MKETFHFLCGKFGGLHFIYGIKNVIEPWHYFEEQDSLISAHESLPALLDTVIGTLDKVRTIKVPLFEHQWSDYYRNKKFIFKDKELKTCEYFNIDFRYRDAFESDANKCQLAIVLMNEPIKTHSLLTIFTDMQFVDEESEKKASNSKSPSISK